LPPPRDVERTFTLRPQDLDSCFKPTEDTWYIPRVAGTFKERAGFHGCQMPEQLLGRIIRSCSNEGDVVLDPFSGSATTLAVAKKLGRRYIGFDLSPDYIKQGRTRLESIRVGDRLDGSPEPMLSAPKSTEPRITGVRRPKDNTQSQKDSERAAAEARYDEVQLELTLRGVVEAFRLAHSGFSADRVVADPELNGAFAEVCRRLSLAGEPRTWNSLLFRLRKTGQLAEIESTERTAITWENCDPFLFASEIALQMMLDAQQAKSLDEILCDPQLAEEFDATAARFAPGFSPLEYRWAALKLRKQAKVARSRGGVLVPPSRMGKSTPLAEFKAKEVADKPGVYVLSAGKSAKLYVGEALNLRERLVRQFGKSQHATWKQIAKDLSVQTFVTETLPAEMLAWQSCLVSKYRPRLNFHELGTQA
jgi:site-specific DNA-methyltransferase (adenine-specific)